MQSKDSVLLTLIFSLAGVVSLCSGAAICGLLGFTQVFSTSGTQGLDALLILVLGLAWCAALLLPGAWYAYQRLQNQPAQDDPAFLGPTPRWREMLPFLLLLLIYPVTLFLGSLLAERSELAWWLLPVLQIITATLPVYWLAGLALRRLQIGSALRRWSVFAAGLVLGPLMILVIEIGVILLASLVYVIQLSSDRARLMELAMLSQRLQYAQQDPQVVLELLEPYIFQPGVMIGVFAFIVVFVPLVEELIKPVGVWLLANRMLSPTEGFAAGVLSGAGYALFENLFITPPGGEWALVSIGRIGTSTMHMLTTGLTGYALASAWSLKRYLRLGGIFGLAVLIHALWNGLTLLSVAGVLPESAGLGDLARIGQLTALGLVMLFLFLFSGLVITNRRLRRYAIIPRLPQPAAVPDEISLEIPPGRPVE